MVNLGDIFVDFFHARVTPGKAVVTFRRNWIKTSVERVTNIALPTCPLGDSMGDNHKDSDVAVPMDVIAY